MAQAGYTPIQLYYSTTAAAVPVNTNLVSGELALNIQDEKLYFKNAAGTVKLLASNATSAPVLSFQTSLSGLTPSTATTGVVTLAGTLGTSSGGTNLTSFTSGGVVYASSSSALATGSALTFDGTNLGLGSSTINTYYDRTQQIYGTASSSLKLTNATAGTANTDGFDVAFSGTTGLIYNRENGDIAFGVNNTEGMRLTTTGLGIGTSSPAYKLDVQQSGTAVARIGTTNGSGSPGSALILQGSVASKNWLIGSSYYATSGGLEFTPSTANGGTTFTTPSMILDSSGNMGLGVTPSAWSGWKALQINSGGAVIGGTDSSNPVATIGVNYYYDGSDKYLVSSKYATKYWQESGKHIWFTAPTGTAGNAITFTQAMTLTEAGKLGIGNTAPDLTLDVYGTNGTNGEANRIMVLQTNNTATAGIGGGIAFGGYYNGTTNRINDFSGIQGFKENSTAGDYAGALKFTTRVNGGSPTERVRIDSAGTFIIKNDYQEQTYTANSSTAITLNITTNGTDQVITLTGTATITMPTATAGKSFLLKLKTGAGGYTVTWSTVKWPGGTAPTLTSTASKMDIFSFFSDGTNWYGCVVGQNYTP